MLRALQSILEAKQAGQPTGDTSSLPVDAGRARETSADLHEDHPHPLKVSTLEAVLKLEKPELRSLLVHMRSLSGRFGGLEGAGPTRSSLLIADDRSSSRANLAGRQGNATSGICVDASRERDLPASSALSRSEGDEMAAASST